MCVLCMYVYVCVHTYILRMCGGPRSTIGEAASPGNGNPSLPSIPKISGGGVGRVIINVLAQCFSGRAVSSLPSPANQRNATARFLPLAQACGGLHIAASQSRSTTVFQHGRRRGTSRCSGWCILIAAGSRGTHKSRVADRPLRRPGCFGKGLQGEVIRREIRQPPCVVPSGKSHWTK